MLSSKAPVGGQSVDAKPGAFLPTLQACGSLEQWVASAKSAGVDATDPTKSVARVCALANTRLQEAEVCQQTHGLVPFG
jgi:hypothetical protein